MSMPTIQKRLWQFFWMIVGLYMMFFIQDFCIRSGIGYELEEQSKGFDIKYKNLEHEIYELRNEIMHSAFKNQPTSSKKSLR